MKKRYPRALRERYEFKKRFGSFKVGARVMRWALNHPMNKTPVFTDIYGKKNV